ncbi:uncharacterized protein [Dermacentor albipictus]|uniref:uncharacterized protein n=1 Tax=Dermacentor albipictus TaxID=60249 RepID=UPI0031FD3561
MGMAAEYAWWRKVGGRCAKKRVGFLGSDASTMARAEAALNKCGQRTRFIWLCTVVLMAMVMSSAAPSAFTDDLGVSWRPAGMPEAVPWAPGSARSSRLVARELVHCGAASCKEAAAVATPPHGRLVWRAPKWSGPQRDLLEALYRLPAVLSHPLELHWWPHKAVEPFRGPFLVLVSTRAENVARRAAIRAGWGNATRYPAGAFRLIFFLAAPANATKKSAQVQRLLNESDLYLDMAVEAFDLSSTRAMMLEWAPEYAHNVRLVFWARDDAVVNAALLLAWMRRLSATPGDVFGRVAGVPDRGARWQGSRITYLPWKRLEQCAYFLKMAALVRMSSVYEDVPRQFRQNDAAGIVVPSLARRANLSLVAIGGFAPCASGAWYANRTIS